MKTLGILVPLDAGPGGLPRPAELALGMLALELHSRGLRLLFVRPEELRLEAGMLVGQGLTAANRLEWREERCALAAVYNRYPSAGQPEGFLRAVEVLRRAAVPWGNGGVLSAFCTDKLRTGQRLAEAGLPYPETVTTADEALRRLADWGALYAKPRFGSLGRGIARLEIRGAGLVREPGLQRLPWDEVRRWLQSLEQEQAYLFQKAVPAPAPGLRGCSIRCLVQKDRQGGWQSTGRVARVSDVDVVANVARGARVWSLDELAAAMGRPAGELGEQLEALDQAVARSLDQLPDPGTIALELGIDYAVDPRLGPVLLEVNGKPLGRFAEIERRGLARGLQARALLQPLAVLDAWSPPAVLSGSAGSGLLIEALG